MAKNKPKRSMQNVGISQHITEEQVKDKFSETAPKIQQKTEVTVGRISPQLSCTVGLEEKKMLNELTLYATNKKGKIVNVSSVLRALIRLGYAKKNELEFE